MGPTIEPLKEDAKIARKCVLHVKCYGVLNSVFTYRNTIDYIL